MSSRIETGRRRGVAAAVIALTLVVPAAVDTAARAQDALGSGNALDRNLGANSGGVNRTSPIEDFRSRNLIVTGDVPGGRGFRGTVGYRAAGDFLDATGSDDLFGFRADSALSAPNYVRYGNTAEQIRFGEDLAFLEFRRESSPSGYAEAMTSAPFRAAGLLGERLRVDWLIQSANSDEVLRESISPRRVGVQRTPDGAAMWVVDASSLLGLVETPATQDLVEQGLPLVDRLHAREDSEEGKLTQIPGRPFRLAFEDLEPTLVEAEPIAEASDPEKDPSRLPIGQSEDYERVVKRIAERYFEVSNLTWTAEPSLLRDLQAEYERMQKELSGESTEPQRRTPLIEPGVGAEMGEGQDQGEGGDVLAPGERLGPESLFPSTGEGADGGTGEESRQLIDFGIALRHGERIDALATDDRTHFNKLVTMAEDALRTGEYFYAERRFIRALRFVPGHPLATAGLGHAQLGAGLYASAALTLRGLLTLQPEMIDVSYDESLLPNRVRLGRVVDELHERLEFAHDRLSDGFLLAYVGRQMEDEALIREGLDAMAADDESTPLLELLRSVWLDEGE